MERGEIRITCNVTVINNSLSELRSIPTFTVIAPKAKKYLNPFIINTVVSG
jgi:hypothetical protein